jgi:hypothetical protein
MMHSKESVRRHPSHAPRLRENRARGPRDLLDRSDYAAAPATEQIVQANRDIRVTAVQVDPDVDLVDARGKRGDRRPKLPELLLSWPVHRVAVSGANPQLDDGRVVGRFKAKSHS